MLDLIIRNGTVVDGTGSPGVRADVGITDGRITAIGDDRRRGDPHHRRRRQGRRTRLRRHPHALRRASVLGHDACHRRRCTASRPSSAGTAASRSRRSAPSTRDYLLHMLARVEGMPVAALQEGVPWNWRSFGEYLDLIDGTLAPERGLPRRPLDDPARRHGRPGDEGRSDRRRSRGDATAARREPRRRRHGFLVELGAHAQRRRRRHGAVALRERRRNPRRSAASCASTRARRSSSFPCVGLFEDFAADLLTRMSLAANRPINWNVLFVSKGNEDMVEHNLAASDYATERGGRVVALTVPAARRRVSASTVASCSTRFPGWEKPMSLPHDEKKAMLASRRRPRCAARAGVATVARVHALELGHLRHQRDVRAREQEVGRQVGRRDREGTRRRRVRCPARHRGCRRSHDRLRVSRATRRRRHLGGTHQGVARQPRSHRRERRGRAPRLPRHVQLLDGVARQGRARARGSCRSRKRSTCSPTCPPGSTG